VVHLFLVFLAGEDFCQGSVSNAVGTVCMKGGLSIFDGFLKLSLLGEEAGAVVIGQGMGLYIQGAAIIVEGGFGIFVVEEECPWPFQNQQLQQRNLPEVF